MVRVAPPLIQNDVLSSDVVSLLTILLLLEESPLVKRRNFSLHTSSVFCFIHRISYHTEQKDPMERRDPDKLIDGGKYKSLNRFRELARVDMAVNHLETSSLELGAKLKS